jgi:hypothetical protein
MYLLHAQLKWFAATVTALVTSMFLFLFLFPFLFLFLFLFHRSSGAIWWQ